MRLIRYDDAIERLGAHLMANAQIDWGGTASTDIEEWKELADMILNGVPTIDAVNGWTPCSERLPKIGEHHISEPCLVYCKGGAYAFAELEEYIFGQIGWNCERDDDYHESIGEVVAWMPLPKPYGEREGE